MILGVLNNKLYIKKIGRLDYSLIVVIIFFGCCCLNFSKKAR